MFRRVAKEKGDHGSFNFAADDGKTLITAIKRRALVDIRKTCAADHVAANLGRPSLCGTINVGKD